MAKATLPTNYIDDIMASSMVGKRRYNMIQNSDGTVSFEDVTDYTKVGSNFGAAQINQTNTAVNNSADKAKIIDDLDDIAANTQSGMMAGALAVRKLNSNLKESILVKQYEYDNRSIPAGKYETFSLNFPILEGYTRMLWTINLENATSSGVNASYTTYYRADVTVGEPALNVSVRNYASSTAKVKIVLRAIYAKTILT